LYIVKNKKKNYYYYYYNEQTALELMERFKI